MNDLTISIEKNGEMLRAGCIRGESSADACFEYAQDYLKSDDASPLSLSLPLQNEPFSSDATRNYFDGLLPEGFTRRAVSQNMHLDENDYVSILHALGKECIGAVCAMEEGETVDASYEPVSEDELKALAQEGALKSADIVTRSHLSLAGATGKAGLYLNPEDNKWYMPHGTAPSTHIVKQSHIRFDNIVANEQISLMTASKCGIAVPDSFIVNTGAGGEREVLFATKRYDRVMNERTRSADNIKMPFRLHQEDFAQAMGIPASEKYERPGEDHLKRMFDILRRYSADPVNDQIKLWDMIIFNFFIGNTDAHIKNFSLLYSIDLKTVRLAPAYDIVSTTVYSSSTRDMAFAISGVYDLDSLTADAFESAATQAGLGAKMAMRRFEMIRKNFKSALFESAQQLKKEGFTNAVQLAGRILDSGGYADMPL